MTDINTSCIAQIESAASLFNAGQQLVKQGHAKQWKALAQLLGVYERAEKSGPVTDEIKAAFDDLKADHKPQKYVGTRKAILWLAFESKQRVSEFDRVFTAAKGIASSEFEAWMKRQGGTAGLLNKAKEEKTGGSDGASTGNEGESERTERQKLADQLSKTIEKLELEAGNKRSNIEAPDGVRLKDGEMLVRFSSFKDGRYVHFSALIKDDELSFPKLAAPAPTVEAVSAQPLSKAA